MRRTASHTKGDVSIRVIELRRSTLRFIDQRALPHRLAYIATKDYRVVIEAIRSLAIRGAPLIGIAAAYGVALAALSLPKRSSLEYTKRELLAACDAFAASRPTAVNLFWSLDRIRKIILDGDSFADIAIDVIGATCAIHDDDRKRCDAIGMNGAPYLKSCANVITHCNTGSLATGGNGTALAVIDAAFKRNPRLHVFVDETRPLLQGARLTTWELARRGIPHTLITDSTAAYLMQKKKIDAAIVGADRIARNGDTANKIGSYSLAVVCNAHNVPFYVAAPMSSFDFSIRDGGAIPIEERPAAEILMFGESEIAPKSTEVFAPAFDVVPHRLITAMITESTVFLRPIARDIRAFATQRPHR